MTPITYLELRENVEHFAPYLRGVQELKLGEAALAIVVTWLA